MRRARSKFGNVRTVVDGITFASKKEARRYSELKLLEKAGKISNLVLQKRFPIYVHEVKICDYVCDFEYLPEGKALGRETVEDTKGVRTAIYKLKKKLLAACYGIEIRET